MTSIVAGGTLTQQLYMRLFDRLNTNGDDALSVGEAGVLDAQDFESAKVFKVLDADGDGRVTRSEMTPSDAFGPETLASLRSVRCRCGKLEHGSPCRPVQPCRPRWRRRA